jgi:hypothetical protein
VFIAKARQLNKELGMGILERTRSLLPVSQTIAVTAASYPPRQLLEIPHIKKDFKPPAAYPKFPR